MSNLRPASSTTRPSPLIRKRDSMSGTRLMHTAIFTSRSECVEPGHRLAEYQRMHVMRPLVRVHAFQVRHVAHGGVLGENPVRSKQTPCLTRDIGRNVHVVALGQRDLLRGELPAILEAAELPAQQLTLH